MLHLDHSGTTNTTPSPAKAYGKTRLAARLKSQGFATGSSYIIQKHNNLAGMSRIVHTSKVKDMKHQYQYSGHLVANYRQKELIIARVNHAGCR